MTMSSNKRTTILILCLLIYVSTHAQKKKYPSPPLPTNKANLKANTTKYTLTQRLAFYPFAKASSVQFVSFGLLMDSTERKVESNYKIPLKNDSIDYTKMDQVKSLTLKQIDTLTDILYNTCSRQQIADFSEAGCYFPRNAILFLDTTGQPFEYLEICFECNRTRKSSPSRNEGDLCDYAYNDLQNFFRKLNLFTSGRELKKLAN
jgi:hypothetical protein